MTVKNMKEFQIKFGSDNFNRLLAYVFIIESLNYKWYKSSKRRFLLPNFYLTKSFSTFFKNYFFKNMFRKNMQPLNKFFFVNALGFFEKKMFFKNIALLDVFKENNLRWYFYNNNEVSFLKKNKFFFKNYNYNFINSSSYTVSKEINIDFDTSCKSYFFKKTNNQLIDCTADFNILLYFYVFNCCLVEIYKINLFLTIKD